MMMFGCVCRATPGELVSDNKVTVKGLTEGKPYEFRVAAVNEAGPSEYAQTKEAIKPAPAPSLFQVFLLTRRDASVVLAMALCPSVCPSQVGVLSKRLNGLSWVFGTEATSA